MKLKANKLSLLLALGVAMMLTIGAIKQPQVDNMSYSAELVFSGVNVPWAMAWLPSGDMIVTERSGKLLRVNAGKLIAEISGLPEIFARGQGGLLDVVLHPEYEKNGWLYLAYSSSEGEGDGGNTTILRAKLSENELVDKKVLYKASPNSTRGQHFGGRIAFDSSNKLYFSVGDRGNRDENPQDITRDGGKIYRINDDGSIPKDNPFVNQSDARKAIFSYGHRNPQGMAVHPQTGLIWAHEHGPQGGDELNLISAGSNYGWPIISYGINYNGTSFTDLTAKEGMEQPKTYWVPSIAPSGFAFVTSSKYPDWKGKALVGSLKFNYLVLVTLNGNSVSEKEIVLEDIGRVRDIRQAPDGFIYVAVEGKGIFKIVPN